jgi:hypothetical protein
LKHYTAEFPGIEYREVDLQVTFAGGQSIRLYGSDNYDRMRGLYFDGVVIDEPADIDPRAWPEVIRPTLADHGGWAVFIGTPRGRNWLHTLVIEGEKDPAHWLVLRLPASKTNILPEAELADARRTMSPEQYEQEFECSFEAAIQGAYYAQQMANAEKENRITGVPYEPGARVWTAWDLGISDRTVIWFAQVVGREIHLIDYYEMDGMELGHYVREIERKPYIYAGHILPHDVEVRELGTGKSRKEVLEGLGLKVTVARKLSVEDGINAVRMLLPRCWFDKKRCDRGVDGLKMYRSEYDDKLQTPRPKPLHDWASHIADAARYLAISIDQTIDQSGFNRKIQYQRLGVA